MNTKIILDAQIPVAADLFMMIIYIKLLTSLRQNALQQVEGTRHWSSKCGKLENPLWLVALSAKHRFSSE